MATVFRLADYRTSGRPVYFNRAELGELLNVYSRRVSSGEWRDYAIDHKTGMAVFSIFRHAAEAPLFSVAKLSHRGECEYLVATGRRLLKRSQNLRDALSVFDRKLVPVG